MKVLKYAQCIKCVCLRTTTTAALKEAQRESVYLCTLSVQIVTLRLFIRRRSKTTNILHDLICVAGTGRHELVFFLAFKTSAGTSFVVGYCDCRHVCDDQESHHEDLDEGDHVGEGHDDHCSASGI